jgi:hypothetical protein
MYELGLSALRGEKNVHILTKLVFFFYIFKLRFSWFITAFSFDRAGNYTLGQKNN